MDIKNFFQSKFFQSRTFKIILFVIGGVVVALLILQAGIFVGYRRAGFSYRWGDNYYRTFGGPGPGGMMDIPRQNFPNAHGTTGKIIKIDLPTFVVEERGNIEKIVLIKDDTAIVRFRDKIKPADLKVDDSIVVIGQPNDAGQIEAKIIRVMPAGPPVAPLNGTPRQPSAVQTD